MVHVDVYVPAYVDDGIASVQVGVTVWSPMPLPTAALKTFVAVGAVPDAGSVYGYVTELVANAQDEPASHASVGAELTVVVVVASVCVPFVNVVDVAVMFQPAPEPVASPTSIAWLLETVMS
jgi:hypothetical protein